MATSMDVGGRTCLSGTAIPLVVNDGECRCLNVVSSAILAGCPSVARVSGDEEQKSTFIGRHIHRRWLASFWQQNTYNSREKCPAEWRQYSVWSLLVRETPQRVPE